MDLLLLRLGLLIQLAKLTLLGRKLSVERVSSRDIAKLHMVILKDLLDSRGYARHLVHGTDRLLVRLIIEGLQVHIRLHVFLVQADFTLAI